jgi:hypothetical protein
MVDMPRMEFALSCLALLLSATLAGLCLLLWVNSRSLGATVLLMVALTFAMGWFVQVWREEYGPVTTQWIRAVFILTCLATQSVMFWGVVEELVRRIKDKGGG